MMYIAVYVKKDMEDKLRRIAEKEGKKLSTVVREWMEEKIAEARI